MNHLPFPSGFNPSKSPIQFDPITILTIAAVGFAGFGVAEMIGASSDQPSMPGLPAPPDPNAAKNAAMDQSKAQRRLLLASGGQTDYTGGAGVLGTGDINKTTLLGN